MTINEFPVTTTRPTKLNSLLTLNGKGMIIKTVLDIGVQYQTPELVAAFPKARHILVEPAEEYHPVIIQNYTDNLIDFELVPCACGEKAGSAYLNLIDIDGSGFTTHTNISVEPTSQRHKIIDVLTIECLLDRYIPKFTDSLLKIDVDGLELEILKGGGSQLDAFKVIIIEAAISINNNYFFDRLNLIHDAGFELWDLVDFCYYKGNLSQVDAIFVRKDQKTANPRLDPWHDKLPFDGSNWVTLFQN